MLTELRKLESEDRPIRVGLVGAGSMGIGIAWQIAHTPGMRLSFIADLDLQAAERARAAYGRDTLLSTDPDALLEDERVPLDVLVESTNTIQAAAGFCLKAIARQAHVVLMNAEVDLMLAPYLAMQAREKGVIVTSDGGDQHGVLARMMNEIELWAFQIVQAGNIKGFLDRYATAASLVAEAQKRKLNPVQCCAYTDGTKLNIEMAVIANGYGLTPTQPGMEGPSCGEVHDVLDLFDFDGYNGAGRVDYILGARPGGGVYVVARCDDPLQDFYLNYYKVHSRFPYYLFYRPYHLCHLETTRAIALAALWNRAVLRPEAGRLCDVYSRAKRDLRAGETFEHGIGGDLCYGLIERAAAADAEGRLPIGLLDAEPGAEKARLRNSIAKDQPVLLGDVDLPDTHFQRLFEHQRQMLATRPSSAP